MGENKKYHNLIDLRTNLKMSGKPNNNLKRPTSSKSCNEIIHNDDSDQEEVRGMGT